MWWSWLLLLFRMWTCAGALSVPRTLLAFRPTSLHAAAASSTTTTTKTQALVSPPQTLYIEDTDAYGVMYNANYMYCYERALFDHNINDASSSGWQIHRFQRQTFRSSPALGDSYVICGEQYEQQQQQPRALNDKGSQQHPPPPRLWNLQMTNPDGSLVYNSLEGAELVIPDDDSADKDSAGNTTNVSNEKIQTEPIVDDSCCKSSAFSPHLSERYRIYPHDVMMQQRHQRSLPVSPTNLFTYMERIRTNCLGGAQNLQRLQIEDGILLMVTNVRDFKVLNNNPTIVGATKLPPSSLLSQPDCGYHVLAELHVSPKRRGMLLECQQRLQIISQSQVTTSDDDDDENDVGQSSNNVLWTVHATVDICHV